MRLIDPNEGALVLVDYQQRLMPAIDRTTQVLRNAVCLADIAHELGLPVLGTEQNPRGLGPNEDAIKQRCGATLAKMHFDACADGLLEKLRGLRGDAPREIVIAGCEAHVCLLQTSLGLLRAGLKLWVVAPASGSRRAADHELAMQRLRQAGAGLVSVEMVAFEWLRGCEHPRFKAVLTRLKAESAGTDPPA
jgi:nicotinamidase-related amidase